MVIGSYYPADPRTSNCLDETGTLPAGDWYGQGTGTCQQMLGCLPGAGPGLRGVTDCMMETSPAVAHVSSELLRCMFTAQNPSTECAAQMQACAAQ
jgi:hypothetical protein